MAIFRCPTLGKLRRYLTSVLCVSTITASHIARSEACLVSTNGTAFMAEHPQLLQQKLIRDTGRYSAVLSNGDSVLANFETCSLGMQAHYLSKLSLDNNQLTNAAAQFLSLVLPSKDARDYVLPQLTGISASELTEGVVVEGKGDGHSLTIEQYQQEGISTIIHYRWIPPEY